MRFFNILLEGLFGTWRRIVTTVATFSVLYFMFNPGDLRLCVKLFFNNLIRPLFEEIVAGLINVFGPLVHSIVALFIWAILVMFALRLLTMSLRSGGGKKRRR
jgi:hypothetical protein